MMRNPLNRLVRPLHESILLALFWPVVALVDVFARWVGMAEVDDDTEGDDL